MKMIPI